MGYKCEEILGKNTRMFYETEQDFDRVGKLLYEQIKKNGIAILEARMKTMSGVHKDTIISAALIDPGDPLTTTEAILDVTQLKQLERRRGASTGNTR
jgi:PAS domain S-box-containing protein